MLDVTDYLLIFLLGTLGGFTSGFLGVGGGIVYIPILHFYLSKLGFSNVDLVKAILANSLFTIIFSGSMASYKQYRSNNFYPTQVVYTALPGIVSVLLTSWLIRSGNWYSAQTFNYVFACMLLLIALRMFLVRKPEHINEHPVTRLQLGITGFFTGIVTALSGLGGGVVMTPVFTDAFKMHIRKASSISNGVIPLLAFAVGIYNLNGTTGQELSPGQVGYIVFPVVLPMIASAILFAPLGVKFSHKAPQTLIRVVFASFVGLVFIKTLWQIVSH